MQTLCGLWAGLFLVVVAGRAHAAPPEPGRNLTAEEKKEIDRLKVQLDRHAVAGQFEEVVRVLQRIEAYRAERQGASHWLVIDARLEGERWQRLTRVPDKDRTEVVRALRVAAEGRQLEGRLRYREAEAKLREALAIRLKVLGEQHSDTATSYSNLAMCLNDQGKHTEALPLHHKALTIYRKELGEQHPETATSYNNLAHCLDEQGKHAEALSLYQKALAQRFHGDYQEYNRSYVI